MDDGNYSGRSHKKRSHKRSSHCVKCGSRRKFSHKESELILGNSMDNYSLSARRDHKNRFEGQKKSWEREVTYGEHWQKFRQGSRGNYAYVQFEERQQNSLNVSRNIFEKRNKQQSDVICIDSSDDEYSLGNKEQYSIYKNNIVSHIGEANKRNEQTDVITIDSSSDGELISDDEEQNSIGNINRVLRVNKKEIKKKKIRNKPQFRVVLNNANHNLYKGGQRSTDNYNRGSQVNTENERNAMNKIYKIIGIGILEDDEIIAFIYRLRSLWGYGNTISLNQLQEQTCKNPVFRKYT